MALARRAAAPGDADVPVDVSVVRLTHERLKTIAVVTSDYASQLETKRKYTGTCASRERHNFLVSVVCYAPYKEEKASGIYEYKQHVDVFFAFHKSGFKPSARSFNVVQEDIDHFLKYGSMLQNKEVGFR